MTQLATQEKFNIVGLVVNVRPSCEEAVKKMLNSVPGVEVHGAEDGRMVVTLDDAECELPVVDTVTQINSMSGVLSTSIAYHHFEGGLANQEKQL